MAVGKVMPKEAQAAEAMRGIVGMRSRGSVRGPLGRARTLETYRGIS